MKPMQAILVSLAVVQLACASASAQPTDGKRSPEVPFTIVSANMEQFPRVLETRKREYREALVVRIAVDRQRLDSLPPSIEAFLYLGGHELRPFDVVRDDRRNDLILTFHDPDWREIQQPVPMVLTTLHGDPQINPEKYRSYPQFDPKLIGRYGGEKP
jgi:hypothetical protein